MNEKKDEDRSREEKTMMVRIKTSEDRVYEVSIGETSGTVGELKEEISKVSGIEAERQRLIHFGKMLSDNKRKLSEYEIKEGDFIHLVPKPKDIKQDPTNESEDNGLSDSEIELETGERVLFSDIGGMFPRAGGRVGPTLSSADYFQRLELGLWRARVRLLSSMMLFYYFLQLMSNLSSWLHPEELHARFVLGHEPSTLFLLLDLAEAVLGVSVSLKGVKAAASDSVRFTNQYVVSLSQLCAIHFAAFSVWTKELLWHQIQLKPAFRYHDNDSDQGTLEGNEVSTLFSVIVNVVLWFSILNIALKFRRQLLVVFPPPMTTRSDQNEQQAQLETETVPIEPSSDDNSNVV